MKVTEGENRKDRIGIELGDQGQFYIHHMCNREANSDSKILLKQAHHLLDFSGELLKISCGLSFASKISPQEYR